VVILDVDVVQLEDEFPTTDELLVFVASVDALGLEYLRVNRLEAGTSRTTISGCGQTFVITQETRRTELLPGPVFGNVTRASRRSSFFIAAFPPAGLQ
jgi:hypothetical protein